MVKPKIDSCPLCKKKLEDGELTFNNNLQWVKKGAISRFGFRRAELVLRDKLPFGYIQLGKVVAARCSACGLYFFVSDKKTKPIKQ